MSNFRLVSQLSSLVFIILGIYACSTPPCSDSYKFNFEITHNAEAEIKVGDKIRYRATFPDQIFRNDTILIATIDGYEFITGITVHEVVNDNTTLDSQAIRVDAFDIDIIDGQQNNVDENFINTIGSLDSLIAIRPTYEDSAIERTITLDFTARDTGRYIISWQDINPDSIRINKGSISMDTCTNIVNFLFNNAGDNHDSILVSKIQQDYQLKQSLFGLTSFHVSE